MDVHSFFFTLNFCYSRGYCGMRSQLWNYHQQDPFRISDSSVDPAIKTTTIKKQHMSKISMWISPMDMCALMATEKSRRAVSKRLASKMGVSLDSIEVLFAMTTFYRHYQKHYSSCLEKQDPQTLEAHRLVEVRPFIFHTLHALGFCTYTDENGTERISTDELGRPVCNLWDKFRAANDTQYRDSMGHLAYPLLRSVHTAREFHKFYITPRELRHLQDQVIDLRPTRFSKWSFGLRIADYEQQKAVWYKLREAWNDYIVPGENLRQLASLERHRDQRDAFETSANKKLAAAKRIIDKIAEECASAQRRLSRSSPDKRDERDRDWWARFSTFISQLSKMIIFPGNSSVDWFLDDEILDDETSISAGAAQSFHMDTCLDHKSKEACREKAAECFWDGRHCIENK